MKFRLEIDLGNDAMADGRDVGITLAKVGKMLIDGSFFGNGVTCPILDANGNVVGHWGFGE